MLRAPATASTLRKRLWQAGFALALFIAIAAAVNPLLPPDKAVSHRSSGHDFLAFYAAGTFVRTGRSRELYDLPAVRAFVDGSAGSTLHMMRSASISDRPCSSYGDAPVISR